MDHILVIKHGALGDVIQATDAFASLRLSFPDASISLLTSPAFGHLLSMSGWFDEIITDERKPVWNIRQSLHIRSVFKRDFDAIIDLQCSRRTARYFKVLQPKGRWFGTVKGCSDPMPDFTDVNNRDRMLAGVKAAGAHFFDGNLDWLRDKPSNNDKDWALPSDYCVFLAGSSATKPSKRWPSRYFAEVAGYCLDEGITPVLCGTADDKQPNDEIVKAVGGVIDLTAQTSLSQLAGLMAGAVFILGNDTGPVFLGARTGQPTIMLMGSDTDAAMSAPYGKRASYLKTDDLTRLCAKTVWKHVKHQIMQPPSE